MASEIMGNVALALTDVRASVMAGPIEAAEVPDLSTGMMAAIGVGLMVFGLILIPVWRFLAPRLLRPAPPARPVFEWVDLAAVFLVFILGQFAVVGLAQWLYPDLEDLSALGAAEALGLTAAGFLAPSLLILVAAKKRPPGLATLGFTRVTPGFRMTFSAIVYVAGLPLFFGLGALSKAILTWAGDAEAQQEVAVLIQNGLSENPQVILALAVLIVPLMEEILFRGFLFELLASHLGKVPAVVFSSAAFAALHGPAAALPIFGLAIILSLVKLRTRSLCACWFVHALHNGATTALLWISTQLPAS